MDYNPQDFPQSAHLNGGTYYLVGGIYDQRNVCPGCGKCNVCGRPNEAQTPQTYTATYPTWPWQPSITMGETSPNGTITAGIGGSIGSGGILQYCKSDTFNSIDGTT